MLTTNLRRGSLAALSLAAAMLALSVAACTEQDNKSPGAVPPTAAAEKALTASSDAVYRGAAVARQVCAQCHDIGDGSKPAIYSQAPTFKSVLEKPDTTAEGLSQWLKSSHPSMPHYVFTEPEVADIVAYIMSLKTAQ